MDLGASVTWDWSSSIVPQALVRSSDWLLIVIGVSEYKSSKGSTMERLEQHGSKYLSRLRCLMLDARYTMLDTQCYSRHSDAANTSNLEG